MATAPPVPRPESPPAMARLRRRDATVTIYNCRILVTCWLVAFRSCPDVSRRGISEIGDAESLEFAVFLVLGSEVKWAIQQALEDIETTTEQDLPARVSADRAVMDRLRLDELDI